ncbi:tRNA dihydrouridine synthase [Lawsonibacter sp. LCP25S3_G6]|uniref:tRNA dihydrouridine synthase n=1 Tax=unclassified Lawsonibacter TaxID=2617946 RepID=UPI003F97F7FF
MELYFAPMEGVTGPQFRRAHYNYFSGVDQYYLPFISPTQDHVFTPRELRNVGPQANEGIPVVPQLLTKRAEDFIWAVKELGKMGYREVNWNLGCPSGTVVAKGKGAGMLADLRALDEFFETVFSADLGGVAISVKTRLGLESPEEFPALAEVFARYPISLLILHPRIREDYYKVPVREEEFVKALPLIGCPLCYNGGLVNAEGCARAAEKFPKLRGLMMGQGLIADPALARKARGGPPASREELQVFHDALYQGYLRDFASEKNAVFHMKELWSYFFRLFEGGEKLFKQIKKAQNGSSYESAVNQIFRTLPLREEADWSR